MKVIDVFRSIYVDSRLYGILKGTSDYTIFVSERETILNLNGEIFSNCNEKKTEIFAEIVQIVSKKPIKSIIYTNWTFSGFFSKGILWLPPNLKHSIYFPNAKFCKINWKLKCLKEIINELIVIEKNQLYDFFQLFDNSSKFLISYKMLQRLARLFREHPSIPEPKLSELSKKLKFISEMYLLDRSILITSNIPYGDPIPYVSVHPSKTISFLDVADPELVKEIEIDLNRHFIENY